MESMGNWEEAETKIRLLDFLYQDKSRIASFYAQLFSGNLIAVTKYQEQTKTKETGLTGKAAILEAFKQTCESNTNQIIEQIEPHDYSSLLLLSELGIEPSNIICKEMLGKVVLLKGSLKIRNYTTLKKILPRVLQSGLLDNEIAGLPLAELKSSKKQKEFKRFISAMFDIVPYGLEMEIISGGNSAFGPVKPECFTQSPDDILRTYGEALGDGWFVLGILDQQSQITKSAPQGLRGAIDDISKAIRAVYAPQVEYIITPILIYREVTI